MTRFRFLSWSEAAPPGAATAPATRRRDRVYIFRIVRSRAWPHLHNVLILERKLQTNATSATSLRVESEWTIVATLEVCKKKLFKSARESTGEDIDRPTLTSPITTTTTEFYQLLHEKRMCDARIFFFQAAIYLVSNA